MKLATLYSHGLSSLRWPKMADLCARLVLALLCAGWCWKLALFESPLEGLVFVTWGWSEGVLIALARGIAILAALTGLAGLILPWRWRPLLITWAATLMFLGICDAHHVHMPVLTFEFAATAAIPFLLAWWHPSRALWNWIGRLAVAATFAAHGLVALRGEFIFVDLLLAVGFTYSTSETLLTFIGWLDLVVALAVLFPRRIAVVALSWCVVWGFATVAARWISDYSVFELLLRAANGGLPLLLLLVWRGQKDQNETLGGKTEVAESDDLHLKPRLSMN